MKATVHPLRMTLFIMAVTLCSMGSAFAQTCVVPPGGLIHWWSGDGNADDIVGGNNGTLQNGASFAAGMVGQAFSFDGLDDFVSIPSPVSPSSTSLTIEAWVKPAGFAGVNSLPVLAADNGAPVFLFGIYTDFNPVNARRVVFQDRDNQGNEILVVGTSRLSPGEWYHIALVWDRTARSASVYVNGAQEATASNVSQDPSTLPFLQAIGAVTRNGAPLTPTFNGLIDELEVYNRVLTSQEIAAIFNAGSAGKCKATTTAYSCTGFEPPFDDPILLKKKVNRSIPLHMQLFSDGTPITDTNIAGAAPVVNVTYSAGTGPAADVTNQLDPVGQSSVGNEFSYNPAAEHWIINLGTKPFTAAGTYTVTVAPGDTSYTLSPTCTGQFVRSE